MKDTSVRGSDERSPERIVGKPLRQSPGREALNEILLDRGKESQGIALDERQAGPPEPVVERERETHQDRHGEPCGQVYQCIVLVRSAGLRIKCRHARAISLLYESPAAFFRATIRTFFPNHGFQRPSIHRVTGTNHVS